MLGLAARRGDQAFLTLLTQDLEQELIFIGLVAMFDLPRSGIGEAIAQCHSAGINVTLKRDKGDHHIDSTH